MTLISDDLCDALNDRDENATDYEEAKKNVQVWNICHFVVDRISHQVRSFF